MPRTLVHFSEKVRRGEVFLRIEVDKIAGYAVGGSSPIPINMCHLEIFDTTIAVYQLQFHAGQQLIEILTAAVVMCQKSDISELAGHAELGQGIVCVGYKTGVGIRLLDDGQGEQVIDISPAQDCAVSVLNR